MFDGKESVASRDIYIEFQSLEHSESILKAPLGAPTLQQLGFFLKAVQTELGMYDVIRVSTTELNWMLHTPKLT